MKVALVHDWLFHMRGGEKVLEAMAELYPDATIYTLFYDKRKLSPSLQRMKIQASILQYFPGIKIYYRWLLPFLPWLIQSLKIEPVDLVVSSSHCVAKGIIVPQGAFHICYCHTPMRYIWGFEEVYFKKFPSIIRMAVEAILNSLRQWDLKSNNSVHEFISNSENVRKRIKNFYGRESVVIYPPLDVSLFKLSEKPRGEYYLVVSAFVPYKRVDLVIEAFNQLDRQLLIVGGGPLDADYRRLRKSEKISFLGQVSSQQLKELYSRARALIFPTEEDFGIVPLEAQACGTPVIAYGQGGALESVKTGVFFAAQSPESLLQIIPEFEKLNFNSKEISIRVEEFDKSHFQSRIRSFVESVLNKSQRVSHAAS